MAKTIIHIFSNSRSKTLEKLDEIKKSIEAGCTLDGKFDDMNENWNLLVEGEFTEK